jgi:hypothetical protein
MTKERGVLVTNVIQGLRDLASYDFQKTAWFENDCGLWSSYNEDVEAIFMDTGLKYALDAGDVVFGKKADNALKELDGACNAIGYHWDGREKELLESDAMKNIRELSRKCLKLVRESDWSQSAVDLIEIDLLTTHIHFADMPD